MNIEIANRLVELRKKSGLSQEELADKLGLSRQAVSKWERAESSPDTDNLICLAKLYNISLDEILKTPDSIEEIAREEKEKRDKEEFFSSPNVVKLSDQDSVRITKDDEIVYTHQGISKVVRDADFEYNGNGEIISLRVHNGHFKYESNKKNFWLIIPYPVIITFIYVILSCILGPKAWAFYWLLFITIPIYYSIIEAIIQKNIRVFAFPVFISLVYLTLGMLSTIYNVDIYPFHTGWHPWWALFLLIPIWYATLDALGIKDDKKKKVIYFENKK